MVMCKQPLYYCVNKYHNDVLTFLPNGLKTQKEKKLERKIKQKEKNKCIEIFSEEIKGESIRLVQ